MKRGSREEEDGDSHRPEKASKGMLSVLSWCLLKPFLLVESLDALLRGFSEQDAGEWLQALQDLKVRSLEDLNSMARDPEAWSSFHSTLAKGEPMLASKLFAWKRIILAEAPASVSPGKPH